MRKLWIRLSSVRDVQRFVGTLTSLPGDFELVSGPFVLDARSLMGILGFDLSRPLCLNVYEDRPETLAALAPFETEREEKSHEQ
ncbi:MAG: HPr family phosphocarrier protein [Candidatus Limiplasma sp.]|nr:HPr family phosphocarrier protein [Candidatus Limiplasma sp.]